MNTTKPADKNSGPFPDNLGDGRHTVGLPIRSNTVDPKPQTAKFGSEAITELHRRANAYPELVAALKEWEQMSESFDCRTDKGKAALAHAVNDLGDKARALLARLGEGA